VCISLITGAAAQASADVPAPPTPPVAPPVRAEFFTSPSELRDELAVHEILPRLYAGSEVQGQSDYQRQSGETNSDTYFDSLTGALRWVPFYGLTGALEGSVDLHGSQGFTIDEATMTLGAVPTEPWYVTAGRTNLPFGEFNSHFRNDPVTQVLGEIFGNEVAAGYETDFLEVTVAAGGGKSDSKSYSWVGNVTFSPMKDMDMGFFWTSDLTRSTEIAQLIQDYQTQNPGSVSEIPAVHGMGTFMSMHSGGYTIDLEYIAALGQFEAGLLSDDKVRPWAWNFEATVRPTPPWEVGLRLAGSSGIPNSPTSQYGLETSYGFTRRVALSLEYLRGSYDGDTGDSDLITAGLLLRW
jgi:hypothetical protein